MVQNQFREITPGKKRNDLTLNIASERLKMAPTNASRPGTNISNETLKMAGQNK